MTADSRSMVLGGGQHLASDNKRASGCGRLWRPSTQPADYRWSRGREVIGSNEAGPGNEVIGPVRRPLNVM